jgi:hypothetical protein
MNLPSKTRNLNRTELEKNDRVVLLTMHGEPNIEIGLPPKQKHAGTVREVVVIFGVPQYRVDWDNEDFKKKNFQILSDLDDFMREEDYYELFPNRRKKIDESIDPDFARKNKNLVQDFQMAKMYRFYDALRISSVVNMWGAAPYFWMGKDRIAHNHFYDEIDDDERAKAFESVLDSADEIKNILVNGSIKTLKRDGKKDDLESVNRMAERKARQIVVFIQQVY